MLVYNEHENARLLEVKHPETIRKLETNMFGPKLARFKNIESLLTQKLEVISEATLLSLPRLKELHYSAPISELWRWNSSRAGRLARVKGALRNFLDDVKLLKGSDFKFTFAGFQLTKVMLDQIDFGVKVIVSFPRGIRSECEVVSNEYVYTRNYHLIEPGAVHFVRSVACSRLMRNSFWRDTRLL